MTEAAIGKELAGVWDDAPGNFEDALVAVARYGVENAARLGLMPPKTDPTITAFGKIADDMVDLLARVNVLEENQAWLIRQLNDLRVKMRVQA